MERSTSIALATLCVCSGALVAHAQEPTGQKFILFDQSAFKIAVEAAKQVKTKSLSSYGIFIDNRYAGQIGDMIRIGEQKPASVKIVARPDGESWSSIWAGGSDKKKLV